MESDLMTILAFIILGVVNIIERPFGFIGAALIDSMPSLMGAASSASNSGAGQLVTLMLGIVGVATGGYGIYRTQRVDSKAARTSDVNDAFTLMKESNAIVKQDLDRARTRIIEQEAQLEEQGQEITDQAKVIREQESHITALGRKVDQCEATCGALEARLNQMENNNE